MPTWACLTRSAAKYQPPSYSSEGSITSRRRNDGFQTCPSIGGDSTTSAVFERSDSFTVRFSPTYLRCNRQAPLTHNVRYISHVGLSGGRPASIAELQGPLKTIYFKYLREGGESASVPSELEITNDGLRVRYRVADGSEVAESYNPYPSIAHFAAVRCVVLPASPRSGSDDDEDDELTGENGRKRSRVKIGFLPFVEQNGPEHWMDELMSPYTELNDSDDQSFSSDGSEISFDGEASRKRRNEEFGALLLSIPHPPMFTVVMRKSVANPELMAMTKHQVSNLVCHLFICADANQAVTIATTLYDTLCRSMSNLSTDSDDTPRFGTPDLKNAKKVTPLPRKLLPGKAVITRKETNDEAYDSGLPHDQLTPTSSLQTSDSSSSSLQSSGSKRRYRRSSGGKKEPPKPKPRKSLLSNLTRKYSSNSDVSETRKNQYSSVSEDLITIAAPMKFFNVPIVNLAMLSGYSDDDNGEQGEEENQWYNDEQGDDESSHSEAPVDASDWIGLESDVEMDPMETILHGIKMTLGSGPRSEESVYENTAEVRRRYHSESETESETDPRDELILEEEEIDRSDEEEETKEEEEEEIEVNFSGDEGVEKDGDETSEDGGETEKTSSESGPESEPSVSPQLRNHRNNNVTHRQLLAAADEFKSRKTDLSTTTPASKQPCREHGHHLIPNELRGDSRHQLPRFIKNGKHGVQITGNKGMLARAKTTIALHDSPEQDEEEVGNVGSKIQRSTSFCQLLCDLRKLTSWRDVHSKSSKDCEDAEYWKKARVQRLCQQKEVQSSECPKMNDRGLSDEKDNDVYEVALGQRSPDILSHALNGRSNERCSDRGEVHPRVVTIPRSKSFAQITSLHDKDPLADPILRDKDKKDSPFSASHWLSRWTFWRKSSSNAEPNHSETKRTLLSGHDSARRRRGGFRPFQGKKSSLRCSESFVWKPLGGMASTAGIIARNDDGIVGTGPVRVVNIERKADSEFGQVSRQLPSYFTDNQNAEEEDTDPSSGYGISGLLDDECKPGWRAKQAVARLRRCRSDDQILSSLASSSEEADDGPLEEDVGEPVPEPNRFPGSSKDDGCVAMERDRKSLVAMVKKRLSRKGNGDRMNRRARKQRSRTVEIKIVDARPMGVGVSQTGRQTALLASNVPSSMAKRISGSSSGSEGLGGELLSLSLSNSEESLCTDSDNDGNDSGVVRSARTSLESTGKSAPPVAYHRRESFSGSNIIPRIRPKLASFSGSRGSVHGAARSSGLPTLEQLHASEMNRLLVVSAVDSGGSILCSNGAGVGVHGNGHGAKDSSRGWFRCGKVLTGGKGRGALDNNGRVVDINVLKKDAEIKSVIDQLSDSDLKNDYETITWVKAEKASVAEKSREEKLWGNTLTFLP